MAESPLEYVDAPPDQCPGIAYVKPAPEYGLPPDAVVQCMRAPHGMLGQHEGRTVVQFPGGGVGFITTKWETLL